MELPDSLNNAISYSWVLGWYAGRDGATTDNGKMQATKDIKEKHPDVVKACSCHDKLLAACKALLELCKVENPYTDLATLSEVVLSPTNEILRAEQAIAAAEPN